MKEMTYDVPVGYLVHNGKTQYAVVIPTDANEAVRYAADEFVSFAFEVSGAVFPILSDDKISDLGGQKYISIGKTKLMEQSGASFGYDALISDGFFIKTVGQSIFMDASNDRAVLYASYDFLERFFGIRFLARDYTHVPTLTSIPFYNLNIVENPAFKTRIYWDGATGTSYFGNQDHIVRQRINAPEAVLDAKHGGQSSFFIRVAGHNQLYYVPKSVYRNSSNPSMYHPEFYANLEIIPGRVPCDTICITNGITASGEVDLKGGDIYVDENGYLAGSDITVAAVVAHEMKKDILNNPHATHFMLGHMDGSAYCKCAECSRQREQYKGASGKSGDTYMNIRLANAVSRKLKADTELTGREFYIVIYAYSFALEPPLSAESKEPFIKLDDNIVVQIAAHCENYYDPYNREYNKRFLEMFDGWKKCASQFMFFGYDKDFSDYNSFYPSFHSINAVMNILLDYNVTNILIEGTLDDDSNWMSMMAGYIWNKKMWNPKLDAAELREEYIELYYGKYARYVRQFIKNYENHYGVYSAKLVADGSRLTMFTRGNFNAPQNLPESFLASLYGIIKTAEADLEGDTSMSLESKNLMRQKLARLRVTPMWKLLYYYGYSLPNGTAVREKYDSAADEHEKIAFAKEFFRYCEKGGVKKILEGWPVESQKNEWKI